MDNSNHSVKNQKKRDFPQVPAITVVLAGYMGCNADAAIIMFVISIGFIGMTTPGSKSSMLDFAPKYSGSRKRTSNRHSAGV